MAMSKIIFIVCLITSIILLVSGFLVPPRGIIDGSVLTGVGELFGFATLASFVSLARGRAVKIRHGNTEAELTDDDK